MEKFNPYHQHLLVKCWVMNPPKKEEQLNKWFINLVETVGMKVVAGPTSVYVSDPGNEGLTGTVTLATSHASIHIWDEEKPSMIQFDIYSCKCFTLEQVMKCCHHHYLNFILKRMVRIHQKKYLKCPYKF